MLDENLNFNSSNYKEEFFTKIQNESETLRSESENNEINQLIEKNNMLKRSYERKIEEINLINENRLSKLNDEIDLLKKDKLNQTKEFVNFKRGLEKKNEEMRKEILEKLESLKIEKEELKKFLEISLTNFNEKLENWRISEMRKSEEERNKFESESNLMRDFHSADEGRIMMSINRIIEIKKGKWNYMFSEYFFARMNPYYLRLKLTNCDNGLWIWLLIYPGESDDDLLWPFEADVTVRIANKTNPIQCKIMRKRCKIDRPQNNSCNDSEIFKFIHSDLSKSGLMKSICTVECLVKF